MDANASLARTPRLERQLSEAREAQLLAQHIRAADDRLCRQPSLAVAEDPHDRAAIAVRIADPVMRGTADELAAQALMKATRTDPSMVTLHLHECRPLAKLAVRVALRYLAGKDGRS